EDRPTSADPVQGAVALDDLQWMVIAEDEHPRRKTDLAGARREGPEGRERGPVTGAPTGQLPLRPTDVLAAGEVVETKPIRSLRDATQLLDGAIPLPFTTGAGTHGHNRRRHRQLDSRRDAHPCMHLPASAGLTTVCSNDHN